MAPKTSPLSWIIPATATVPGVPPGPETAQRRAGGSHPRPASGAALGTLHGEVSAWSTDVNGTQRGVDWQMKGVRLFFVEEFSPYSWAFLPADASLQCSFRGDSNQASAYPRLSGGQPSLETVPNTVGLSPSGARVHDKKVRVFS